jgi:hypothetical protein
VLEDPLEDLASHRVVVNDQDPVAVDDVHSLPTRQDRAPNGGAAAMNLDTLQQEGFALALHWYMTGFVHFLTVPLDDVMKLVARE